MHLDTHVSANDDVDEDTNSAGRESDDVEGDTDEEGTGRGDSDEGDEDEPEDLEDMEDGMSEHVHDKFVDQLNGDEDSDEELTGAGSEMEDERSEFDYGDLKEHIMEDNDEVDDEDDLEESDFGADDGEGAADNEDETMEIIITDTKHTIVVPNIFLYMIPHIVSLQALQCLLRHLHSLKPHLE
jgi:hypothetical protein